MESILVSAKQALDKTKIQLMSRPDSVFFMTICFSLKHKWDESISTAAVDGVTMFINPGFFLSLDHEERLFLVLHETLHVAYMHMLRLNGRDRKQFNIAADHVINLMLIDRGYRMPKMVLADPQYSGMSAEEVYALLPDQTNTPMDMDLLEPSDAPEDVEHALKDILVRASIQSKLAGDKVGTIPGEIEIFLNGLLNPKLPWNRILQKHIQATAKNDYSFKKPNRRYFPQYHLPSLHSETLMDIAIAIDTSGSITDEEFHVFVTEIASIFRMMKPNKITVIQFDTAIKSVTEVRNLIELRNIKFYGRGGTRINPVLQWANDNKPQLLLVFTDGYFYRNTVDTKVNTVWVINNNEQFKAPFGKQINYTI